MEKIKPKVEKPEYELDDNDFCLIKALEDLANAVNRLANKTK